jgi:hypothetical protein
MTKSLLRHRRLLTENIGGQVISPSGLVFEFIFSFVPVIGPLLFFASKYAGVGE